MDDCTGKVGTLVTVDVDRYPIMTISSTRTVASVVDSVECNGNASTHLVNRSATTRMYV